MSFDLETVPDIAAQGDLLEVAFSTLALSSQKCVFEFGDDLLDSLNRAKRRAYHGVSARSWLSRSSICRRASRETLPNVLNQDGYSPEMSIARRLVAA